MATHQGNTTEKTVEDVASFWESNPLFVGESGFAEGTKAFYEHHRQVYEQDCFAGDIDERVFPTSGHNEKVLDLGCGVGFWSIELKQRGAISLVAADLTENALKLTSKRAEIYQVPVTTSQQNAEALTFHDEMFTHVNCQGVIHHTPDTERCVAEIARVLGPGGSALISVYYKNVFINSWPVLRFFAKGLAKFGAGLKGRGREDIFKKEDAQEIVRLYDGEENPIGKAYSRKEFKMMLTPYFDVEEMFLHFFPARSLPFSLPRWLHRSLDKYFGFMVFARCTKRQR